MSKYCLITGASSGIGEEFAYIFAKNNYDLILVARRKDRLEKIKETITKMYKVDVICLSYDLSSLENIDCLFKDLKNKNIFVHTLINNAGFAYHSTYVNSDYNKQQNLIDLNISCLSKLSYLFGKEMANKKEGEILNIASIAAYMSGPYAATYYASKSYVLSFSEALKEELKPYNVVVSCICPGPTETEFEEKALLKDSNMFKSLPVMKASKVAKIGFNALKRKRTVVHCGIFVKFGAFLTRFFPRCLTRKVGKSVNKNPLNK